MVAASAPEFSAPNNEQQRRAWQPDGNDHLIFNWVKLKGHSQDWVATQLGISQSTVSRVVQRYERWQAHAREREGGRLDHTERLRAQRWLTYERNEALLATCLRIASEMEGVVDVTKSTIRRGNSLTDERDVSTQHSVVDRSGIAARFLRLAFRINMEQLKLCELDPPPVAEPLSDDELADELKDAAAAAAEFRKVRPSEPESEEADDTNDSWVDERSEMHPGDAGDSGAINDPIAAAEPDAPSPPGGNTLCGVPSACNDPQLRRQAEGSTHHVHNLHNVEPFEIAATTSEPCTCASQHTSEKNSPTCIANVNHAPPLIIRLSPDTPLPAPNSQASP